MAITKIDRVTWRFRNVTQAFDFWPRLDSISITDAGPEEEATFSCEVEEEATFAIEFEFEDEIRITQDDGSGAVRIFAGHLKDVGFKDHGPTDQIRTWILGANDYTALLRDDVITGGATRRAESASDRLDWILSWHTKGITVAFQDLPAVDVESVEMLGESVMDALEAFCQDLRLSMFVDFSKGLHIFRTETTTAPFALAVPGEDDGDPAQYWGWEHHGVTDDLHTKAFVMGDKRNLMVPDAAAVAIFGSKEVTVQDSSLKSSGALTRAGERELVNDSAPVRTGGMTIGQYGLRAGMTVEIAHDLWPTIEDHSPYIIVGVETTAVDPHDSNDEAQLRCTISYADRRRRKSKGRNRGGGDHNDGEDGAAVTDVQREASFFFDSFEDDPIETASYGNPATKHIGSVVFHNLPYTTTACPLGAGGWSGESLEEGYYELDTTASLDPECIGIRIDIDPADPTFIFGMAASGPYVYGVKDSAPSAPRYVNQYLPLGNVDWVSDGASVMIPRNYINEGGTTYFVIAPDWRCASDAFFCAQDLADGTHGPAGALTSGGEGLSGQVRAPAISAVYRNLTSGRGETAWVPGDGDIDGVNREFSLQGWDGSGVPRVKVNGLVLSAGDYSYSEDDGTVTLDTPPEEGDVVMFRYKAATV